MHYRLACWRCASGPIRPHPGSRRIRHGFGLLYFRPGGYARRPEMHPYVAKAQRARVDQGGSVRPNGGLPQPRAVRGPEVTQHDSGSGHFEFGVTTGDGPVWVQLGEIDIRWHRHPLVVASDNCHPGRQEPYRWSGREGRFGRPLGHGSEHTVIEPQGAQS